MCLNHSPLLREGRSTLTWIASLNPCLNQLSSPSRIWTQRFSKKWSFSFRCKCLLNPVLMSCVVPSVGEAVVWFLYGNLHILYFIQLHTLHYSVCVLGWIKFSFTVLQDFKRKMLWLLSLFLNYSKSLPSYQMTMMFLFPVSCPIKHFPEFDKSQFQTSTNASFTYFYFTWMVHFLMTEYCTVL